MKKTSSMKTYAKTTAEDGLLIIVESPSKIKKIEEYLGRDYQVIACCGHIRTLSKLSDIDCENGYQVKYTVIEEKKNHISCMQAIVRQYKKDNIILATDNDREGEAIAFHLSSVFGLDIGTTTRIHFNEITSEALHRAVSNTGGRINMDAVRAQMARQIIDLIIGFKISPQLWKCIKSKSLSAGRCQTPALRLIYDNETECLGTISSRVYKTKGSFFAHPFTIQCDLDHAFSAVDELYSFLEKSRNWNHTFVVGEKRTSIRSAPIPYNTSRLLQDANNNHKYTPKQTTDIAQKLYQQGHITYIRTESNKYSEEFLGKASKYIVDKFGTSYIGNIVQLSNKGDVLPHEAIRVTELKCLTVDPPLNTLYKMIWKNTMASCMPSARFDIYNVTIAAPCDYKYAYELSLPMFLGWTKIFTEGKEDDKPQALKQYLNNLITNTASLVCIHSTISERGGKSHYTESGLIRKLEELQIGRPSTYATFVETLIEKGYVKRTDIEGSSEECDEFMVSRSQTTENFEIIKTSITKSFGKEKNKLVIQPIGIVCIELLIKHFNELFDYSYTKSMESMLDQIVDNDEWWHVCESTDDCVSNSISLMCQESVAFSIDETYELIFRSHGMCVRHKDITKKEYLPMKTKFTVDMVKLKNGEYSIDDLVEFTDDCIGIYMDKMIYRRIGKFGPYLEWGDIKKGCKDIGKSISNVTLEEAITFISCGVEHDNGRNKMLDESKTFIRVIDINTSIRKGKFGPYIYYKTKTMKKPRFTQLKTFSGDFLTCSKDEIYQWMSKMI